MVAVGQVFIQEVAQVKKAEVKADGELKKLGKELKGAVDRLEGKKAEAPAEAPPAQSAPAKPLKLLITEVHSVMHDDGFEDAIIRIRHLPG